MKCVVKCCGNNDHSHPVGISFHRFPREELERSLWINFTGLSRADVTQYSVICSEHFFEKDLIRVSKFTRLSASAVPALKLSNDNAEIATSLDDQVIGLPSSSVPPTATKEGFPSPEKMVSETIFSEMLGDAECDGESDFMHKFDRKVIPENIVPINAYSTTVPSLNPRLNYNTNVLPQTIMMPNVMYEPDLTSASMTYAITGNKIKANRRMLRIMPCDNPNSSPSPQISCDMVISSPTASTSSVLVEEGLTSTQKMISAMDYLDETAGDSMFGGDVGTMRHVYGKKEKNYGIKESEDLNIEEKRRILTNVWTFFCFIIIASYLCLQAECARILAVAAFPGKSHFQMHSTLVKELLQRGHKVTFITNFPIEEKISNYTEILIDPIHDFWQDVKEFFKTDDLFSLTKLTTNDFNQLVQLIGLTTTDYALRYPKVQKLLHDADQKFDLLLAEQFYQEAFLALAYQFNIPVVTATTLGFGNYMSQMMGYITPWAFVPHGFLPYDDKMNLYERFLNTFYSLYEDYDREINYFPQQDALVHKYFSHLKGSLPTVSTMEKKISVILLNSHIPITTPRPFVPGMVQVGGLHIKTPKPLPNDIQQFLDDAVDGAIYFSLGTNLRSSDIPPEKLSMILRVFAGLKQRILWKWEDENVPDLPKNIMIKSWMPQSDILAHRNVKVFITHGGLFGTQEGLYRAVPMLGFPIYCDQTLNINKAVKAGYAISLHFPNITETSLNWALSELIYNPFYQNNIQRISTIFRDRPMPALDTAMYWIEYVIRYKGAPQIRSAGADMPWYSFYMVDIIGIMLGVLSVVFGVCFIVFYQMYRCLKSRGQNARKKVD